MSDETNPNECEHGVNKNFNCEKCAEAKAEAEPSLGHPMQAAIDRPIPDAELERFLAVAEKAQPNEGIPVRADTLVWLCKTFRETRSACADLASAAGEERKGSGGARVDDHVWEGLLENAKRVLPA